MSKEKAATAEALIQEQLQLGHIEPSTSPWNTPIFIIKKKSGKWRLLQDLREINKCKQPMDPLQCGLPNPNLIPQKFSLYVIDLKDCFFTLPLFPEDWEKFAFTIPTFNHHKPTNRFQWKVLPQGVLNSPTLRPYFVNKALVPFHQRFPHLLVYHYMDDTSLAGQELTDGILQTLQEVLLQSGLHVAPEKNTTTTSYLQQFLGHLYWAHPYISLTTDMLSPFF